MTLDTKNSLPDPPLRGHLVIFVDGYKMRYSGLFHVFSDGHRSVSVPDSLVPPPDHEVGSDEWWQDGWAVGDNARNRLCKRLVYRHRNHRRRHHVLAYRWAPTARLPKAVRHGEVARRRFEAPS